MLILFSWIAGSHTFSETLSEIGNLGQSECLPMRIRYLQVSCHMLSRVPNERKWQMLSGTFVSTTNYELPENLAKRVSQSA